MKTKILLLFLSIFSASAQTNFFNSLSNTSGGLIMTNVEFRSIVGRKMIFKQIDTGALKPVDVELVDDYALKQLQIDRASAIAKQQEMDEAKAKVQEYYKQQSENVAKMQKEKERIAGIEFEKKRKEEAIAAAIAEEQRKKARLEYLDEQQRIADIEATKAEASRAKAAAGYLNRTP